MRVLIFEGVSFNVDLNCKKTKKQFVDKAMNNGLYSRYKDQKKLIEEAYRLIKAYAKTRVDNDD